MPVKILLADDNMTAQNMGRKILADAGFDVVAVSNGAAALKKFAEQRFDMLVLDIFMPGYTGLEVCQKVKLQSRIPVLLSVGKLDPYKAEDGTRAQADGVVVKPFEATDLVATVERLVSGNKASKAAKEPADTQISGTAKLELVSPLAHQAAVASAIGAEIEAMPVITHGSVGDEEVDEQLMSPAPERAFATPKPAVEHKTEWRRESEYSVGPADDRWVGGHDDEAEVAAVE